MENKDKDLKPHNDLKSKMSYARLLLQFLKGSKLLFILSVLFSALSSLCEMLNPQIIRAAIDNGYIEPLVTVSNRLAPAYRLFPNIIDIINDNGTTGLGTLYPRLFIIVKPKKSTLNGVSFHANRDSGQLDGLAIDELRNFDMSITPTN